jgi:hypothetical protein
MRRLAIATASQLDEWRKHRRQSFVALRVQAVFLPVTVVVLICLHWWVGLSLWVWLLVLGFSAFGLVGDLINIVYLDRRIAAAERDANRSDSTVKL